MVRATNSSKTAFRLSTTSKRVTRSTDSAPFEPRKVNAKMDGAPSTSPDARRSAKADKNGLGCRPHPGPLTLPSGCGGRLKVSMRTREKFISHRYLSICLLRC